MNFSSSSIFIISTAVSKAFTCLSDPSKRRNYDVHGHEDAVGRPGFGGGGGGMAPRRGGSGFFDDDIDPEEIFRMFFGGNPFMSQAARVYTFGGQQRQQRHPQRAQQQQQQQGGEVNAFKALFSLLPFILLVLFNLLSQPSRPAFSLAQSRTHPAPLATAAHGIPFFVGNVAEFSTKYRTGTRERTRIELQIETEWREGMQRACYNERLLKHRYEYFGQKDKAARVSLASCDALAQKFGGGEQAGTGSAAAAE